jgi:transcription elongation factor GreA
MGVWWSSFATPPHPQTSLKCVTPNLIERKRPPKCGFGNREYIMVQTDSTKLTHITPTGLARLENELEYLKTVKRREVARFLQETLGDVEETEYLIAVEEQAFVEGRIRALEGLLANVQVIEPGKGSGLVDIGSTVVVKNGDMESETFTIVGSAEADPKEGLISNESPLGKALLGSRIGDNLEIKAPAGILKFRVLAIQ